MKTFKVFFTKEDAEKSICFLGKFHFLIFTKTYFLFFEMIKFHSTTCYVIFNSS